MSEVLAQLAELENKPSLFAHNYSQLPSMLAAAESERADGFDYSLHALAAYGFSTYRDDKPFFFSEGIAVIPVMGALLNRYNWIGSYASGYQAIRSLLNAAVEDNDVKGIVLDVNSYGGMVQGCFELGDDIYAARSKKPILAVVDANAYSAGYALASAATKIVATRSAGVGSIGVVMMHMDMSQMLKEFGIKVTFIKAGKHKTDGNPYEPLDPKVKADFQDEVDDIYDEFVTAVARNRGIDAEAVRATEAQTYRVDEALKLGLIDAVASPTEAMASFIDELSGSNNLGAFAMANENQQPGATSPGNPDPNAAAPTTQPAAAQPAAQQNEKQAERDRISGILNCEEAKGKSTLANHLALSTELSVDAAKGILKNAAAEAAAPATEATNKPSDAFAAAMAKGNPNVGAGDNGGEGDDTSPEATSSRILANYAAASGKKFDKK